MVKVRMRRLKVAFEDQEQFLSEYASNIANGGIFLPTEQPFEVHDAVLVEIKLGYCRKSIKLQGKVVHRIPPEIARAGAKAGVAVQFSLGARELRAKFEPIVGDFDYSSERRSGSGRRGSVRKRARVSAKVESPSGRVYETKTQDLSRTGALLTAGPAAPPVGEHMRISLDHPTHGEGVSVEGRVVRHVSSDDGEIAAVGVEFDLDRVEQRGIGGFLQQVEKAEHGRRLGAICGPIDELGIDRLLGMFGGGAGRGTLTVFRGQQQGSVVMNEKTFVGAYAGPSTGIPALAKMLSWRGAEFEFTTQIEPVFAGEQGTPIDQALREARSLQSPTEESEQPPTAAQPGAAPSEPMADAKLRVDFALLDQQVGELTKTEEAVIDLAIVGMPVGKVIDVIPESREDVLIAVANLREIGLIIFES